MERWQRTVKVDLQGKCRDFDEFKARFPNYIAEYNSKSPHLGLGLMTPVALYFADLISAEEFSSLPVYTKSLIIQKYLRIENLYIEILYFYVNEFN